MKENTKNVMYRYTSLEKNLPCFVMDCEFNPSLCVEVFPFITGCEIGTIKLAEQISFLITNPGRFCGPWEVPSHSSVTSPVYAMYNYLNSVVVSDVLTALVSQWWSLMYLQPWSAIGGQWCTYIPGQPMVVSDVLTALVSQWCLWVFR